MAAGWPGRRGRSSRGALGQDAEHRESGGTAQPSKCCIGSSPHSVTGRGSGGGWTAPLRWGMEGEDSDGAAVREGRQDRRPPAVRIGGCGWELLTGGRR
jgi:hypothetical protein